MNSLGIIRLGSDTEDNYYQVEIPLKITGFNAVTWLKKSGRKRIIYAAAIESFGNLKLERLEAGAPVNEFIQYLS